ncbi:MAG: efflux RND transporter periplasmic adaptor subunit [Actinomyces sp.]|nr:efflux RND transporter periplasmic adaptor subunit [Actinomyces sp.]
MAGRSKGAMVLSVIKVLAWVVIAVAFVKFAFFPSANKPEGDALDPGAQYGQMTVLPEKGTITNTLSLEGTIEPVAATPVKATMMGEVTEVYVQDGQNVAKGDPILLIQREETGEDQQGVDEEGNPTVIPGEKYWKSEVVYAPADGALALNALVEQQFNVGDPIGSIQPPTFVASASLTPDQMYRMQQTPEKATITIKNGPAPFECTGLRIDTPKASGQDSGSVPKMDGNSGSTQSGIRATCTIPGDQKVFAGLQVTMDVVAGEAADVMTLPATAVEGRFQNGYVYMPTDDPANPTKVEVKLGITDGKRVQIVEGLTEDQEVLEFIPGQQQEQDMCDPMTGEGC